MTLSLLLVLLSSIACNSSEPLRKISLANVEGALDGVRLEFIAGWVRDASQPGVFVSVDVYADGHKLGTIAAGEFRADFKEAGMANGRHSFIFALPPHLVDGQEHVFQVKVAGTDREVAGSPITAKLQPRRPST